MRISVFGLGYVGVVSSACLARDGHDVIGVDVDETKLDLLRNGKSPIIEEGIGQLVADVTAGGKLTVTDDALAAIAQTDLSFICVGTPSNEYGNQDQSAIQRVCETLASALATKEEHHTLVFRSTLLPGTVEAVLVPLLEDRSGKKEGAEFSVCFQPEFLREGSSIKDYDNPPFTVVGCRDPRPADRLRELFGHLDCDFAVTTVSVAESMKFFCNIFHALKITFANEVGRICQSAGVDSHEVMSLLCKDRQLNISPAYMKPGFAFGGSCLPKDLRAMLYMAKHNDVQVPMLNSIERSNQLHITRALRYVLATGKRKVGMIGLSFKSGTDDLRTSPLVTLAERMLGKGIDLHIYDPDVQLSHLIGANRRFIEETIPHIGSLLVTDHDELLRESEVIVLGQAHPDVVGDLSSCLTENQVLLDCVNLPNRDSLSAKYIGICW